MSFCFEQGIPHSEFLDWAPEDKAKTLAFAMEQAARCSMCGTAPWEWEENKYAYTAVDEFCNGCYQKSVFSDQESRSLPGTNVKLIATTPLVKAKMQVAAKRRRAKMRSVEE